MKKFDKQVIKRLIYSTKASCEVSKPDEYDGLNCAAVPIEVWPLEKWCVGCLAYQADKAKL